MNQSDCIWYRMSNKLVKAEYTISGASNDSMQGQCIHDLYIYLYSCCKSVSDKCEQPIHTFTLNSCQTFHCNCYEIQ